mmetsp:Transcript_63280/g.142715  ORF Transcript_63280/g.142715 Transcript_63280/m.142715 type:complete len:299 (-) Transcript_63280:249-1145(-)
MDDFHEATAPVVYEVAGLAVPPRSMGAAPESKAGGVSSPSPPGRSRFFRVGVARHASWLSLRVEEEDRHGGGDSAGSGLSMKVDATYEDWVRALHGPLSTLGAGEVEELCASLCGALVVDEDEETGQALGVSLDPARFEEREEGAAVATVADFNALSEAKAEEDEDEGEGEGGRSETSSEADDSAGLYIEVKVRAGSDDLWVLATNEDTGEIFTAAVPAAAWRPWLEDSPRLPESPPRAPVGGGPSAEGDGQVGVGAFTAAQKATLEVRLCGALRLVSVADDDTETDDMSALTVDEVE